jgi:hypothetical protein
VSRVALFVDYLDFCASAEETFGSFDDDRRSVHVDPARLADVLTAGMPGAIEMTEVRVYRGVPDGRRDEAGFAEALRQMEAWRARGVVVVRRPLDEPDCGKNAHPGRSRALSVALAVDLLTRAWTDEFDAAILCSRDGALEPAVRGVLGHTWKRVFVAAWRDPHRPASRLRIREEELPCWWLNRSVFDEVVERES